VTTPLSGTGCHSRLGFNMINLSTKFEVSTITHYEDTKGNAKWRNFSGFGRLGPSKVIGNITIWYSAYDFLFDFKRNCVSIFHGRLQAGQWGHLWAVVVLVCYLSHPKNWLIYWMIDLPSPCWKTEKVEMPRLTDSHLWKPNILQYTIFQQAWFNSMSFLSEKEISPSDAACYNWK